MYGFERIPGSGRAMPGLSRRSSHLPGPGWRPDDLAAQTGERLRGLLLALLVVSGVACNSTQAEPTPPIEYRLPTATPANRLETDLGMADVLPAHSLLPGLAVQDVAEGPASAAPEGDGAGEDEDGGVAAEAAVAGVRPSTGTPLTSEEVDALYAYVGVPAQWRADLKAIAWCESQWRFYAVGDSGASLGFHQLWHGWAREGEDLMDPVTNTWVAVRVREIRGRFGGRGGWTCADLLGIW